MNTEKVFTQDSSTTYYYSAFFWDAVLGKRDYNKRVICGLTELNLRKKKSLTGDVSSSCSGTVGTILRLPNSLFKESKDLGLLVSTYTEKRYRCDDDEMIVKFTPIWNEFNDHVTLAYREKKQRLHLFIDTDPLRDSSGMSIVNPYTNKELHEVTYSIHGGTTYWDYGHDGSSKFEEWKYVQALEAGENITTFNQFVKVDKKFDGAEIALIGLDCSENSELNFEGKVMVCYITSREFDPEYEELSIGIKPIRDLIDNRRLIISGTSDSLFEYEASVTEDNFFSFRKKEDPGVIEYNYLKDEKHNSLFGKIGQ